MLSIILLIEKTAANKHFDIFLKIVRSICRITLKLRYFSYIYISYQVYITWSCVAFRGGFIEGGARRATPFP